MPKYNSPLFNDAFPLNTTKSPLDHVLAKRLRGMKVRRSLMKALNGAAVGANNAVVTEKRVTANGDLGGPRAVETRTRINRATTNADKQLVDKLFTPTSRIATPRNLAGTFPA